MTHMTPAFRHLRKSRNDGTSSEMTPRKNSSEVSTLLIFIPKITTIKTLVSPPINRESSERYHVKGQGKQRGQEQVVAVTKLSTLFQDYGSQLCRCMRRIHDVVCPAPSTRSHTEIRTLVLPSLYHPLRDLQNRSSHIITCTS